MIQNYLQKYLAQPSPSISNSRSVNTRGTVESQALLRMFATPVFKYKIHDLTMVQSMAKSVLNLKKQGQGKGDDRTWCSRDDLQTLVPFRGLVDIINTEAVKILDVLYVERDDCYIQCMWSNVSKVGTVHQLHVHPNSFLSGVMYLQTPPGSGNFYLSDPRNGTKVIVPEYTRPDPEFIGGNWNIEVQEGDLYFFPSWLPHGVMPSPQRPDSPERISLSFNIMLKTDINLKTAKWSLA
jgi:uncharacterized protein (TIGR02466 family)